MLIAATACDSAVQEQHGGSDTGSSGQSQAGWHPPGRHDCRPRAGRDLHQLQRHDQHVIGQVYDSLIDYPTNSLEPAAEPRDVVAAAEGRLVADPPPAQRRHVPHRPRLSRPRTSSSASRPGPTRSGPCSSSAPRLRSPGFDTSDPHKIVLKFDAPAEQHLRPARRDADHRPGRPSADLETGKRYVGTGPYEFVSWTPQSEIVFKRNPDYWRGASQARRHRPAHRPRRTVPGLAAPFRPARRDPRRRQPRPGDPGRSPGSSRRSRSRDRSARRTSARTSRTPTSKDVAAAPGHRLRPGPATGSSTRSTAVSATRSCCPGRSTHRRTTQGQRAVLAQRRQGEGARHSRSATLPTFPLEYSTASPNCEAIAQIVQANLKDVGINVELQPNENAEHIQKLIGGTVPGSLDPRPRIRAVHAVDPGGLGLPVQRRPEQLELRLSAKYKKDADAAWTVPDGTSAEAESAYKRSERRPAQQPVPDRGRDHLHGGGRPNDVHGHHLDQAQRAPARATCLLGKLIGMARYLLRRLPSGLLVLFLASVLIFLVIRLVPGDPVATLAGPDATPAAREAIRSRPRAWTARSSRSTCTWIGQHADARTSARSYIIGGNITDLVSSTGWSTRLSSPWRPC